MQNFHHIVEAVQTNCYINDARHAQDMTMCTYLLEMRQFFRWEHSLPYSERLPKDDLGSWLIEREALWERAEMIGADLVAVGSHGRRGVSLLLLGSVAEATVRHAPCSVLVAR